jgi:hypothetical protein
MRLLWPVLIVAAVVLAVVVTAAGEQTRVELEYLDQIRTQAIDLSRSGASLREVMPMVRTIDRDEFTTVFDSVGASLDVGLAFVADPPPTDTLVPVWVMYRQILLTWQSGVDGLSTAILQAADHPDDVGVETDVADALVALRAGDNLYADFQEEFDLEGVPDPVNPLVDVTLSPADTDVLSLASSYVAAAQTSTSSLGLRPGLEVSQIISDPKWQINVDGRPVVPNTDTIRFSTVITNSGNVASGPETVEMTLTDGSETMRTQAEVRALSPSGQTTVVFDPVDVVPDTLYEITVSLVEVALDSNLDDNSLHIQFTVNPA